MRLNTESYFKVIILLVIVVCPGVGHAGDAAGSVGDELYRKAIRNYETGIYDDNTISLLEEYRRGAKSGLRDAVSKRHLPDVTFALSEIYSSKKEYVKAIDLRNEIILSMPSASMDFKIQCLKQNGNTYVLLKDYKHAVESYDRILRDYPNYGKSNGEIVNLLYYRAAAFGYPKRSLERRKLFEEIWNNKEYENYPQIYNIGRMIVSYAFAEEDYAVAIKYSNEVIGRLKDKYNEFSQKDIASYGIDTSYKESLLYSGRSSRIIGNLNGARDAYNQLLTLFPSSIFTNEANDEIKSIDDYNMSLIKGIDLKTIPHGRPPTSQPVKVAEITNNIGSSSVDAPNDNKDRFLFFYVAGAFLIFACVFQIYMRTRRGRDFK